MQFTLSIKATNGGYCRAIDRYFPFNEIDSLEKSCELKLPTSKQFPHPAIMLWEVIQEMKKEVTPVESSNNFNSYDPSKNDYGFPISSAPDVPAV